MLSRNGNECKPLPPPMVAPLPVSMTWMVWSWRATASQPAAAQLPSARGKHVLHATSSTCVLNPHFLT